MSNNLYNEYYGILKERCWGMIEKREDEHGEKFWHKGGIDYEDEINNMPITINKTNVENSEWKILHHMIVQYLIDCVLKHEIDVDAFNDYSINIDLHNGEWKFYINNVEKLNIGFPDSDIDYSIDVVSSIDDEKVLDECERLNHIIYLFVTEFIRKHGEKLGYYNMFYFSFDNIKESIKKGRYDIESDSSLSLFHNSDLVLCSILM